MGAGGKGWASFPPKKKGGQFLGEKSSCSVFETPMAAPIAEYQYSYRYAKFCRVIVLQSRDENEINVVLCFTAAKPLQSRVSVRRGVIKED